MRGMINEVPSALVGDAEVLAAVQGLVPVRSGEVIRLLPRKKVISLVEERREAGDDSSELLAALEFNGEAAFRQSFSQLASATLRASTSTIYLMLLEMSARSESRDALVRQLLARPVEEMIRELALHGDEEKVRLLRLSLDDWAGGRESDDEADVTGGTPSLRVSESADEIPSDLRKYSRYFLKNLFRLNNIHGSYEFFHPPEVIEDYWEVVAPYQGVFDAEIVPSSKSLTVRMFLTSRSFGLTRTENPDYFDLVELLVSERRSPRVKGSRVEVHGITADDEVALEEVLSIESMLVEDPTMPGLAALVPMAMSPQGLASFRSRLRNLSGIKAEVQFPVNVNDPYGGDQEYSVLGFDLDYDLEAKAFILDEEMISPADLQLVVLTVGGKLLGLSRQLYRDPANFPAPDVHELESEVHALIARAEDTDLTEELAKEIVTKITVLDYYESLAKFSYALSERIVSLLDGKQDIEFTMPRALLALLNAALLTRNADEMLLDSLEERR
jgi:hypothetical protein